MFDFVFGVGFFRRVDIGTAENVVEQRGRCRFAVTTAVIVVIVIVVTAAATGLVRRWTNGLAQELSVGSCFALVLTLVSIIGGVVALRAGSQRLLQSCGKGFIREGDRLDRVSRRSWGQFRVHAGGHVVNLALFWHRLGCIVHIIEVHGVQAGEAGTVRHRCHRLHQRIVLHRQGKHRQWRGVLQRLGLQHQLLGILQQQRGLQGSGQRGSRLLQLLLARGGLLFLHTLHTRPGKRRRLVFVRCGLDAVAFYDHDGGARRHFERNVGSL